MDYGYIVKWQPDLVNTKENFLFVINLITRTKGWVEIDKLRDFAFTCKQRRATPKAARTHLVPT